MADHPVIVFVGVLVLCHLSHEAIPKFEITESTGTSVVMRMINGENVTSFSMTIHIYNLDELAEYRRTELTGSLTNQLFSFDDLLPATWFAFRIHYTIKFANRTDNHEMITKQELVVRTQESNKYSADVNDTVAKIEDSFINKHSLYISVTSAFKDNQKVITLVVPELTCTKGIVKPLAQQINQHARFHFDLSPLEESLPDCSQVCIYPYLRVSLVNALSETFRAKEWCGSIDEVKSAGLNSSPCTSTTFFTGILVLFSILHRLSL